MSRFLAFLALLVLAATPGAACSVEEGYKVPSNFELVQKASVIILARVKEAPTDIAAEKGMKPMVLLEPLRFLKGSAPTGDLRVMGWRAPKNWSGVPTVTTLGQSHFSAGLGACVRQFYEPGELVVAMFEPNSHRDQLPDIQVLQLFNPFAREVETVDGPDDIWVRAVEKYVALQAGPSSLLNDRIKSAMAELEAVGGVEAQAMADDLDWHCTRTEQKGVWVNFSTPMSTTAAIAGNAGVGLTCLAGTAPTVLTDGMAPTRVELFIKSVPFEALPYAISAVEKRLLASRGEEGGKPRSLLRFKDPAGLFAAFRSATEPVEIKVDGKTHAVGRPLDALFRWASQCEKLQKSPAPSERDVG